MRLLISLQLALLAAVGAATVARFPVFALVDERAHYAFVQEVAEEHRLPYLGRAYVSAEAEAIDEGSILGRRGWIRGAAGCRASSRRCTTPSPRPCSRRRARTTSAS